MFGRVLVINNYLVPLIDPGIVYFVLYGDQNKWELLNAVIMSVLPRRHLVKAITWRVVASLTTFIIGWVVTGNLDFGMAIGAADVVIKIALYYLHERAWYHSTYGVVKDGKHETKPLFRKKNKMREARVPVERDK